MEAIKAEYRFVLGVAQIISWVAAYELANFIHLRFYEFHTRGVDWGIAVKLYVLEYAVMVFAMNMLIHFFDRFTYLIFILFVAFLMYIFSPTLSIYPMKTALVFLISAAGLSMEFVARFLIRYFGIQ